MKSTETTSTRRTATGRVRSNSATATPHNAILIQIECTTQKLLRSHKEPFYRRLLLTVNNYPRVSSRVIYYHTSVMVYSTRLPAPIGPPITPIPLCTCVPPETTNAPRSGHDAPTRSVVRLGSDCTESTASQSARDSLECRFAMSYQRHARNEKCLGKATLEAMWPMGSMEDGAVFISTKRPTGCDGLLGVARSIRNLSVAPSQRRSLERPYLCPCGRPWTLGAPKPVAMPRIGRTWCFYNMRRRTDARGIEKRVPWPQ
jgi:hypothetical protein